MRRIGRRPWSNAAKPTKATRVSAGRALSLAELQRLKRAASKNLRDAVLVTLLAEGGLRVSELVQADAANWSGDTLRIVGKGNRERVVPFEAPHALFVSAYLDGRTTGPLLGAWKGKRAGARLTVRGVQHVLSTLAKRAKLGPLSPHDLRRTCLTLGNAAGVPIQHLAALAGHASTSTTAIYIRSDNLELSREAARRKHAFYTEQAAREAARKETECAPP